MYTREFLKVWWRECICLNVEVQKGHHTQMLKLNQGWFRLPHESPSSFTLPDTESASEFFMFVQKNDHKST